MKTTKIAILDYQLSDALEMYFSKKYEILKELKKVLLNRPIKDFNLYSVSSFVLEDALVAIRNREFDNIKRLYILNSDDETFKTYCLHLIHQERRLQNGRKIKYPLKPERSDSAQEITSIYS